MTRETFPLPPAKVQVYADTNGIPPDGMPPETKRGRKPLHGAAMTAAERQARSRALRDLAVGSALADVQAALQLVEAQDPGSVLWQRLVSAAGWLAHLDGQKAGLDPAQRSEDRG